MACSCKGKSSTVKQTSSVKQVVKKSMSNISSTKPVRKTTKRNIIYKRHV